jgi:general secretion pathway protein L
MDKMIFIRIHKDDSLDIYLPGSESVIRAHAEANLDELEELCRGKKLITLLPGSDLHMATVMIPARNRQKVLQAVPYAMEEDLIGDINQFHFAIPARINSEMIPVCAIDKNRLEDLLARFKEHHLSTQVIIADTLCLPCPPRQWNIIAEDQESTVQTSPYSGFTVDTEGLADYLNMAIQEAGDEAPIQLNIIDARSNGRDSLLQELASDTIELTHSPAQDGLLKLLAGHYREGSGINLLQGDYTPRKMASRSLKKWYPAAAVLAIILLIQAGNAITYYVSISRESDSLNQKISALFKQAMPDVKRMVDPKNQMQQRLQALQNNELAGNTGFLSNVGVFANSMQSIKTINLSGMSFRNGRLDIEMTIGDLQALENLKQLLTKEGMTVEIRSAAVQGDNVSARLRIQENKS